MGLGWLAGHVVFAPLTWTSVVLACCSAIAYQGALVLERNDASSSAKSASIPSAPLPWALALLYGGQITTLFLLVVLGRSFAATLLGALLAPQWLLLALLETQTRQSYVRHAIPFVAISMLVAAWAIST